MKAIPLTVAALVLAACETPAVTGASRDEVIVRYDPSMYGVADAQPEADAACARFGMKAHFAGHDEKSIVQWRHARFVCR